MTGLASSLALIGLAAILFVTTNLDDLLVLVAFWADGRFSSRQIATGQSLGIVVIVGVSLAASLAISVLRPEQVGLLGFVPILIGLKTAADRRHSASDDAGAVGATQGGRMLAVAGVTIANGGDNVGVYVPLLAGRSAAEIVLIGATFAAMTVLWLAMTRWLVAHPTIGAPVRRYGAVAVPVVMVALGGSILIRSGALGMLLGH